MARGGYSYWKRRAQMYERKAREARTRGEKQSNQFMKMAASAAQKAENAGMRLLIKRRASNVRRAAAVKRGIRAESSRQYASRREAVANRKAAYTHSVLSGTARNTKKARSLRSALM